LEQLGPTYIKIGQLLSMRPDVMPAELIDELRNLQERVAPDSFEKIKPIVEKELGAEIGEIFEEFETEAVAGASMAQVHRAKLRSNREWVAVKVQRPNLSKVIDSDFDILMWFVRQAHERIDDLKPYDLPGVFEALREGLERELDFRREARSIAFFALQNPFPESICAPKVHEDYCSRRVLVMQWIDGARVAEIEEGSEPAKLLAGMGARSLFHQILINGFFHADPHSGNVRMLDDGKLCLLDWGSVGQLTRRMRYGLVDLFLAFIKGDSEKVMRTAIGLADVVNPIDRRTMEREIMFSMREHYNPDTGEGDIGRAILHLLYVFGRNGVDLARDYSLMSKAILCVEETGKILDPDFNLKDEFEPVLRDLVKERANPWMRAGELRESLMQGIEYLQMLPDELHRILRKVEKDKLKVNLQHKGLEDLDDTISDASNKITLGIILGCLLVGSSLIVSSHVPPIVFGYPILGWMGYLLSAIFGTWVVFDILRGRR